MTIRARVLFPALVLVCRCGIATAADPKTTQPVGPSAFVQAKTLLQTNISYDPRIAIAVDGVIVHQHGVEVEPLRRAIESWKQHGYCVGRMFFADSDAQNEYWTGKWDGTPHPDDVERDASGQVVLCAGVRPYMLPTEGWTRHLQEMAAESIDAGADAILPEEPLAHAFTGYEQSFRDLWVRRFARPWEAESASAEARFLTGQLKNELYVSLEQSLLETTRQHARQVGREVAFVLPVHSLYSNVAAQLVAPLGTSLCVEGIDGYIGQVWTGPVNWARAHYGGADASFFTSAYALYDYFVQLVVGTDKRLWLLADPVEDDPNHTWADFETWYRHSVAAKLLFPAVDAFEVMPWPDRIFLPGYASGGGTPAPERYRIIILSAVQTLQEIPVGGRWEKPPTEGVGVVVADTVLWEKRQPPMLQDVYGLLQPLLHVGIPVSACIMERAGDPAYLNRFRVIVVAHEIFKPIDPKTHTALADWVKRGGCLVLLGGPANLDDAPFWWKDAGHDSPLHHLLAELGGASDRDGEHPVGRGWVMRRQIQPRRFADPAAAKSEYFPLIDTALHKAGAADGLRMPGSFCMRRGPFVIAGATSEPLRLSGPLLDVFDPDLPIRDAVQLEPGQSGVYRDVGPILSDHARPRVLHCTHRLMADRFEKETSHVTIRGPAETPAVVRIARAGREVQSAAARKISGEELPVAVASDVRTVLARFPNHPGGAMLEIRWRPVADGD